jgi:NDP-sugar pyrophosphorylase family protein
MINAGAWFVEPGVLGMVQPGASVSFERDVFPKVLAEGQPFVCLTARIANAERGTGTHP